MGFADPSGEKTWAELGWENPAATAKRGAYWIDPIAEAKEWERLVAEEKAAAEAAAAEAKTTTAAEIAASRSTRDYPRRPADVLASLIDRAGTTVSPADESGLAARSLGWPGGGK